MDKRSFRFTLGSAPAAFVVLFSAMGSDVSGMVSPAALGSPASLGACENESHSGTHLLKMSRRKLHELEHESMKFSVNNTDGELGVRKKVENEVKQGVENVRCLTRQM